ncbi:MAG: hypothetical protein GF320_16470 [Armatimonadia bacterium]|nr:hypothetical protein [Armatimonadia bacterium]
MLRLGLLVPFLGALVGPAPVLAADGDATAVLTGPQEMVAGEPVAFHIEVTIGEGGIAEGGAVSVGIHHAATWPDIQVDRPGEPGHVSARAGGRGLPLAWHGWLDRARFADPRDHQLGDFIFHQCLVAEIDRALAPGDTVVFDFGGGGVGVKPPVYAIREHEFRVMTDADGDGILAGIERSPIVEVVAGEPHHLSGVLASDLQVGEPALVRFRVEDRHHNLCADHEGTARILSPAGRPLERGIPISGGIGSATITPLVPGPLRLRLDAGPLIGRCSPAMVHAQMPRLKTYWGDIHGHTAVSDGLARTMEEYFAFGRDVAFLDVCALTDHGHFDWPGTTDAVRAFHEPGRYVTLLAQEAGAGPDHRNLYFRSDDADHIQGWPGSHDAFNATVLRQYNWGGSPLVAAGPHHFTYPRGDDRYPFQVMDPRFSRFVEVYSSHGTSEYLGNPRPLVGAKDPEKFLQAGLAAGHRFGVIASSDNHDSHPGHSQWGRYPGGLVAFRATELTREAVWQALWEGRTYATSLDRVYIDFRIQDQGLCAEVHADGPVRVDYVVVSRGDDVSVHLIRDNEVLRTDRSGTGTVQVSLADRPAAGEHFYYLRVVQGNGERAWSSPIWVTVPAATAASP